MAEAEVGTGESQPAEDTIHSALAAAFAAQEDAEAAEKPAKPAKVETEVEAEAKEPADKEAAAEAEKPAKTEKVEAEEKPDADKAATTKEPPANWSATDKATFKGLPEPAQTFLLSRHKQMEADYTKKTQAIAEFKKEYDPVEQLFAPHRDAMRSKGLTPRSLIESWANVEKELASGEDRAVNIVKGIISGYKLPVAKIAAALGIGPQTQAAKAEPVIDPATGLPKPDPGPAKIELPQELLDRLSKIEQFTVTEQQRRANEAAARRADGEAKVVNEIESFKTATDAKGTLLHPHFEEVEAEMTSIANGYLAMKQPVPALDALYEKAVWATPSTREKLRTAEQQAAEKKRTDEARAKAAAAKKASASVTGAPGAGQAPSGRRGSDRSIREELEEAASELDSVA